MTNVNQFSAERITSEEKFKTVPQRRKYERMAIPRFEKISASFYLEFPVPLGEFPALFVTSGEFPLSKQSILLSLWAHFFHCIH